MVRNHISALAPDPWPITEVGTLRIELMCLSMSGRMVVLSLLFLASGCDPGKPTLSPVRGKVYYRNLLLTSGTVVFTPDTQRGGRGDLAVGEIGPDGTYVLKTANQPGAAPGWHRVTVTATQPTAANYSGYVTPHFILPEKYRDPEQSGQSYEVRAGQLNIIDIRLD